ncbi:two-component response regulator ORR41-like [Oryza brachyantha]|uniref:Response regulatory domain-containing protein n=1 Tax=Oryza brachyantha TaxID=4533 RepID=J3LSP9_ORYBR|nr:two-component response regulator ORR41-like [Oryza brachyantha]
MQIMARRMIRVLLVEDEEINRVVARAALKAAMTGDGGDDDDGHVLDEAENGEVAVQRVRAAASAAPYDLILMDRQMPAMDGHEATRRIRAMGVTTPIVAVSSDGLPADVEAFIGAGADDFTSKPLTKEKLGNILSKFRLA